MILRKLDIHIQRLKLGPYFIIHTKMDSNCIKGKCKTWNCKTPRKKKVWWKSPRYKSHDDFLDVTPNAV